VAWKKPLREQIVVVTGASSGLGRAVARLAGRRGAKVVVTARNAEALEACVREIEAFGS
jgi:NADP-dependent 3-hydroxy acid dehydrogenase YdfG